MSDTPRLDRRPQWAESEDHRAGPMLRPDLRELVEKDPGRADRTVVPLGGRVPHASEPS